MIDKKQHLNLSNLDHFYPYYQAEFGPNNPVVGKMKDEASSNPSSEFVGLRPKMDSFEMVGKKPDESLETVRKQRAKCIGRSRVGSFDH